MTNTTPETPQNTNIFYARKYTGLNIGVAILLIIVGLFAVSMVGAGGAPIGIGILFIIITIMTYNMHYVIIGEDYIAVKPAPARSRVNILFSEITSVTKELKKITIFYKIHGEQNAQEKKVIIALNILEESEKQRLLLVLNNALGEKIK
ncbi:hypothetical protein [Entomomonas asaccharolytica]|uniref:Uncharacterized protein n=1 Tax=Entomomonas asaccharolytica TaxID=2785331 RepID=A0A974RYJ9_9GAMM|nr:hypothetical protein [Entomomonas asaccharolytica]QQP85954.1 hypothetical protein JHT90_01460 [Entomomonas asaccharolytica]